MFTGIVEELGAVESSADNRLRIRCSTVLADATLGSSIAVNGCCLTVVDWDAAAGWWSSDVSGETLARTSLGALRAGDLVNLERPVRADGRLGGHIVQGHVDGVGTVCQPVPDLRVDVPGELGRYIVAKGSIAVDGVSLTVVDALAEAFTVAIIPHTAQVTTLGRRVIGDPVNLEVDVTAKYVERLLTWQDR
ncbi:MAG: riboflavin synthase [Actinomycetota bacterium]|nr:riboflavin synthase [Actinomycetota bacterium]